MSESALTRDLRPKRRETDWTTKEGAEALLARIKAKWPGRQISLELVEQHYTTDIRHTRYDLRSDMVDGLPRGARDG